MSYSQVFFSRDKVFAVILLLASFIDVKAGLSGLVAILVAQALASLLSFDKLLIKSGTYTYNCLMVGLGIGVYYEWNISFALLLIFSTILTFFLSVWLMRVLGKNGLPFLSLPFLIALWIVLLGAGNFSTLVLEDRGLFTIAEPESWSFNILGYLNGFVDQIPLPDLLVLYFKSLGAIFFQFNVLGGILISIGLLYFSRIAFTLSIYSFFIGYGFYHFFQGDFTQLIYSYIGFNFILTGIALGGFFLVPSWRSYLLLIIIIPIIALLISGLHSLFMGVGLPLYSLPFNVAVFMVIVSLRQRSKANGLDLAVQQQVSPEVDHYKHHNRLERFRSNTYIHLALPVLGEWYVSQGYKGDITHKGDWSEAIDFDVRDEEGNTYRQPGTELSHFYCYNLPVLAPAAGWVVKVVDIVPDNDLGEVNLENNWGNTIIIKHTENLYTKLSHLRKDTAKVKEGDYVEQGEIVAHLGSSGRSPEPHLHFQVQATPYIGSKTIDHPFSYFMSKQDNEFQFHAFEVPQEGATIRNVMTQNLLTNAFNLIPGKTLEFRVEGLSVNQVKWEVFTDALNYTYIYCHTTGAIAYFTNNKTLFYFTDYQGDADNLLRYFYLGAQKLLLGYYNEVVLEDQLLMDGFYSKPIQLLQDFTAPFHHFCKVNYTSRFTDCDNDQDPDSLTIQGKAEAFLFHNKVADLQVDIKLENKRIEALSIQHNNKTILATCVG